MSPKEDHRARYPFSPTYNRLLRRGENPKSKKIATFIFTFFWIIFWKWKTAFSRIPSPDKASITLPVVDFHVFARHSTGSVQVRHRILRRAQRNQETGQVGETALERPEGNPRQSLKPVVTCPPKQFGQQMGGSGGTAKRKFSVLFDCTKDWSPDFIDVQGSHLKWRLQLLPLPSRSDWENT